ncbi:MAG TPA: PilZ domain-containing protein [Symbiobacteriaceae bacterium]|nr:PilZ domain-containing protein [Symbiobacteriaceae bacterium]
MPEVEESLSRSPSELIQACSGHPVRVSFLHGETRERASQVIGGVGSVRAEEGLTISCVGSVPQLAEDDGVVAEVLVEGVLLLLFARVVGLPRPREILLSWPREVRTEQRRQHPRIDTSLPLHFQIDGQGEIHRGHIDNISAGGLSFITHVAIPADCHLSLAFGIGSGFYFHNAGARVLRTTASFRSGLRVAVQFEGMEREEIDHLSGWIHDHLPPERLDRVRYRT